MGIPLADPLAVIEYHLINRHLAIDLLIGGFIVLVFYFIVGGRVFCSWFCPIHLLSEIAQKFRKKTAVFKLKPSKNQKYVSLSVVLVFSLVTSQPIIEIISPVGSLSNNIVLGVKNINDIYGSEIALGSGEMFGNIKRNILNNENQNYQIYLNSSLWVIFFILLIEMFLSKGWWCSYTCPVGALYSLVGWKSLTKIKIDNDKCTQCGDCYSVCMNPEVLQSPVKGYSNWVKDGSCSNCINCVGICPERALKIKFKRGV